MRQTSVWGGRNSRSSSYCRRNRSQAQATPAHRPPGLRSVPCTAGLGCLVAHSHLGVVGAFEARSMRNSCIQGEKQEATSASTPWSLAAPELAALGGRSPVLGRVRVRDWTGAWGWEVRRVGVMRRVGIRRMGIGGEKRWYLGGWAKPCHTLSCSTGGGGAS